ncbi:uncharacterized protein LOC127882362 [Dreissena polymorpha]|uniref:CXXC-type domain-containing protein n=1 Tax=Dreissena polymorpha TaxID=45954 RepID=A0A9D4MU74_DREPO|nr:uncharacterized protein LOC127882362 [Dreissena polymorpha]KAH3882310.1 hypothetical protein DPMN_006245 [Dreissena polymorpha]
MSDSGPSGGMSFPQKVHTEDEDFVIELDDHHLDGAHDAYGMDDRSRCKRRKRCGQCGPCQVKENCMKCHFCVRKDVLKQTCIYRKCIYLRSKPKPYSRPHQSPQGGNVSPQRAHGHPSQVKSPPLGSHSGMAFHDAGGHLPDARSENPFFPSQLPQQPSMVHGAHPNNGYLSPPNPVLERTAALPNAAGNNSLNMQMNMSPHQHVQANATSPPVQKPDHTSPVMPQPVNSPLAAGMPGLHATPMSSCSSVPHMSASLSHVGPTIPLVMQQMSNNSLSGLPTLPTMGNIPGLGDRSLNDYRSVDQFPLSGHHPHFPSVHPHMTQREPSGLFSDHARISHMNYNHTANHLDTLGRGPNDSSCMYHPGLSYSMPGPFQPSGPSFFTGPADMNPFRSNFLNSFPPGYSYPPDRYREGFGTLPFSRLGITSPTSFPQYPGQGGGYRVGNALSQQYYNSQHGCPKNGSRPPVSPSIDDVKVIQEGYNKNSSQKSTANENDVPKQCKNRKNSEFEFISPKGREKKMKKEKLDNSPRDQLFSSMAHLQPWNDLFAHHAMFGGDPLSPNNLAMSQIERWRLSPWYNSRSDDVRSRASTSTLSSDFECEVIGIDDQQVNALIRSDGCNSIEIEFDNRSISSTDSSPRKMLCRSSLSCEGLISPDKNLQLPFNRPLSPEPRSFFHPWNNRSPITMMSEQEMMKSFKKAFNIPDSFSTSKKNGGISSDTFKYNLGHNQTTDMRKGSALIENEKPKTKTFVKESVCIKQDLGEEGSVQLELPGNKVTIENIVFTEELLKNSSDIEELRKFISNSQGSTDQNHVND